MEGDNARQNDDGWDHQFEKGAQQNPFLPFCQILGSQRFLHNRLVRTPEKHVGDDKTGEQGGERHQRIFRADRVKLGRVIGVHLNYASPHVAVANIGQRKQRYHQPTGDQAHPVDGIGHRDGFDPAKYRVNRAQTAHAPHHDPQRGGFIHAEHMRDLKQAFQRNRPGIQHDRQQRNHVHPQE